MAEEEYINDSEVEEEIIIRREGEITLNARLSANTKAKYARHIMKWEEYMRQRCPELWIREEDGEGGEVDLENVTTEQFQHFFV